MQYKVRQNAERIQLKDEPDFKGQLEIIEELIAVFEEDGLAGRELSTMSDFPICSGYLYTSLTSI